MGHALDSLKGDYIGDYYGGYLGDTRTLDHGSYVLNLNREPPTLC